MNVVTGNSDSDSREVGTAEDDASEVRFEERGESVDRTEDIEECKEEKSSVAGLLDKLKAHPRRLAAIAGGIVLVIAVAVVVYLTQFATMPDITGYTPTDAQNALAELSGAWEISYATDEGEDVSSIRNYAGYEVKETDPAAGELLVRNDAAVHVQVTIGKTEETIQKERQAIIDAEIADSLENGWEREEYEDGGTYVLFRAYRSETIPAGHHMSTPSAEGDSNVERFRTMAAQLKTSIICVCYTQDGYLYKLYYAPYSEASDEDLATDTEVLKGVVQEALAYNRDHAQEYLDFYCAGLQEAHRQNGRPLTCEYTLEPESAAIYLMYDWADMEYTGNAREINEARAKDQETANWLAWCTGRTTSVLTYTSENELFESFEAEANDYNPLIVIDPAPAEE
ncbi:PASTA domain-containing protein [[Collinsella] massiliensis]|uniref:PASTA domain-containing protein n=1 Tax=[Collinsella] massiliensis TaxID=1232426 RepID=UPI00117D550E|nr:PASTA domain-containing protein [[Collinsella] massiliensis]